MDAELRISQWGSPNHAVSSPLAGVARWTDKQSPLRVTAGSSYRRSLSSYIPKSTDPVQLTRQSECSLIIVSGT